MGEVYNGLFDMDLTSISDDASKIIQRAAIQAKKAVESAGATLNLGLNYEGKDDRDPVVAQMEEAVSTIKGIWGTFAEVRSDVASLTKLLRDKQLPDAGKDYGDALAKIKNAKQVDYTAEASKNIQNAVLAARELDKCLAEAKLADEDADVAAVGVKQDKLAKLKCPITRSLMEEPMRNTNCDHRYSKMGIHSLLTKKPEIECPIAGCGKKVSRSSLIVDDEIAMELEDYKKKKAAAKSAAAGAGAGAGKKRKAVEDDDESGSDDDE